MTIHTSNLFYITETIIDSITNALPVKFSKKSPQKKESPMKIETLQTFAPELLPNDILSFSNIPNVPVVQPSVKVENEPESPPLTEILQEEVVHKTGFKMPKMPLVSSEVMKLAIEKRRRGTIMEDAAVNTGGNNDVANEIAKYVGTLKKISLIAEEFNQKTGKDAVVDITNLLNVDNYPLKMQVYRIYCHFISIILTRLVLLTILK